MPAPKSPLHPRFQPPKLTSPAGERVQELERTIEILGIVLVATTPPRDRDALRKRLEESANVAWSSSLPTAASVLRRVAEAVPHGEEEPF